MTTPAPNSDETSKMKRIENAGMADSIKARLPHGNVAARPLESPAPPAPIAVPSAAAPAEGDVLPFRTRLLTAFWTVASVISLTVNVILIALLFILVDMIAGLQLTANDQVSGLLGGLYDNFVKMDQATISRVISVDANVPLNFEVPVHLADIQTQQATQIQLAEDALIKDAHVRITEGGVQIDARKAEVTLPAGTRLSVNIQGLNLDFKVPIQNTIPVHLDVPVNIPLNQTELHQPFTGLRQVVEPYYCLVEPNAQVNGLMVCGPNP